jgi:uncharacterized protein
MEGIKINKRPRLKKPYMIVAWPGMGEVAFKAASYMVEQLKAEEFAQIIPEEFFYLTGSTIQDGILDLPELPQSKFYYWKNPASRAPAANKDAHDLIIFLSNAQPDLAKAEDYSQSIIHIAKTFGADTVISFASMPQPIDHTQDVQVWLACTTAELKKELSHFNFRVLTEGQISGMNGLFLGIAKRQGLKGFCLLGEIPFYTIQIENPKASQAVLQALCGIMDIKFELSGLNTLAHNMEGEINKLLDYLKLGSQGQTPPIGEEEIEKIKKTLSQLTKLPVSIKEKVERLFEQAKTDITKASELKAELDKWNAYKEYEDRFLDLFRKAKDKGN